MSCTSPGLHSSVSHQSKVLISLSCRHSHSHWILCEVTEGRFHDRQLILQLVNYRLNLTVEFRFTRTYVWHVNRPLVNYWFNQLLWRIIPVFTSRDRKLSSGTLGCQWTALEIYVGRPIYFQLEFGSVICTGEIITTIYYFSLNISNEHKHVRSQLRTSLPGSNHGNKYVISKLPSAENIDRGYVWVYSYICAFSKVRTIIIHCSLLTPSLFRKKIEEKQRIKADFRHFTNFNQCSMTG